MNYFCNFIVIIIVTYIQLAQILIVFLVNQYIIFYFEKKFQLISPF